MNKQILRKQRVRILATGELGTVAEKVFIKRQGGKRPELYCRVWLDKKPGEERWYWASQLGGTKEYAHATFTCGEQELNVHVTRNYETDRLEIDLTGTPENLKEHRGLHMMLMTAMMSSLVGSKENIERAGLKTED